LVDGVLPLHSRTVHAQQQEPRKISQVAHAKTTEQKTLTRFTALTRRLSRLGVVKLGGWTVIVPLRQGLVIR